MAATVRSAISGVVPVVQADAAAAVQLAAAAVPVAHELVNDPGRDAGVLQPGGEGVAEVVGAVQLDHIGQGVTSGRQHQPAASSARGLGRQGRPLRPGLGGVGDLPHGRGGLPAGRL
jgi:hypothetical protein